MSSHILKNEFLTLKIKERGAELTSIYDHTTNTEYLWNADPAYWKRHSPILFPIVGSLKNKSYMYQGKIYHLPQHGFARDMNFTLMMKSNHEIWFSLEATDETLQNYPFRFRLELGYRLEGRKITVLWKVINQDRSTMYFSIGGHPAFYCPLKEGEKQSDYYLSFHTNQSIRYLLVNEHGLVVKKPIDEQNTLTMNEGLLPIGEHMFDHDALIIEDHQSHQVSLCDSTKRPYLTVTFDAPLFGIWSPAGMNAPFICIEPWYGRCDASDWGGPLEEREWGNSLKEGEVFDSSYTIEIAELTP